MLMGSTAAILGFFAASLLACAWCYWLGYWAGRTREVNERLQAPGAASEPEVWGDEGVYPRAVRGSMWPPA